MEGGSKLMGHDKVRSSFPPSTSEILADFKAAVHPFHRLVYLVAFAYTKNASLAERVAIDAITSAFKEWSLQPSDLNDLKLYLIRTAISESRAYLEGNATLDGIREDLDELIAQQGMSKWRPIVLDPIQNSAIRSLLTRALRELTAPTAVTLLLRDAFHLTTLQIADVTGESHQRVQSRLAYGRIALCVKMANGASDRKATAPVSLAAAY
jgi:DNA-directed RNA polymerase specialized sigma24 family protein